jgi:hypothetical protein
MGIEATSNKTSHILGWLLNVGNVEPFLWSLIHPKVFVSIGTIAEIYAPDS